MAPVFVSIVAYVFFGLAEVTEELAHPFGLTANALPEHVAAARAAGADLILGGHIHLPFVRRLDGDGLRTAWAVQAGTAVSHRVRPGVPNSVYVVRWQAAPGACAVAPRSRRYRPHSRCASAALAQRARHGL